MRFKKYDSQFFSYRWSFQDQYFAKQGPDGIYMYDTEVREDLIEEKKILRTNFLAEFSIS